MKKKEVKPTPYQIAKEKATRFKREFRKSIVTAISAAFGFLIALVWKDAITEFVNDLTSASPLKGTLFTAIVVTIIAVLGIMLVSKFAVKED
ncbi:MAG: DUF5654 family protein [archaeon]